MASLRLPSMPSISTLLRLYNVKAVKKLSQNFLMDPRLIDKVVRAAGPIRDGLVCEVGPGPGGITRSIISKFPKELLLIEKDIRFKPMLDDLAEAVNGHCKVSIKYADILDFNLEPLFDKSYKSEWKKKPPNIHIIGNLPFDVSTILMIRWLKDISLRRNVWSRGRVQMTLTFQKEVAERMVAPILTKKRCRLSVMCQNWCDVNHVFNISGKAFSPRPDVNVSVVHAVPVVRPVIDLPFDLVEKVVRTIFGCKQKFIVRGIRQLFPEVLRDKLCEEVLVKTDLSDKLRPYQMSIEEHGRIVHVYKEICDRDPSLYAYNYRGKKSSREKAWEEERDLDDLEDEDDDDEYDNEGIDASDGKDKMSERL